MMVVSFGHTWDYRPGYDDWLSRKAYATKEAAEKAVAWLPWYTVASVRPIIDGFWHIRAGDLSIPSPKKEEKEGDSIDDRRTDARRAACSPDAEAATALLYKLLTYVQQAGCEDARFNEQERAHLDAGWIAQYAFYLPSSLAGASPLERAITWTMPNGRKFKISVQDITEEESSHETR